MRRVEARQNELSQVESRQVEASQVKSSQVKSFSSDNGYTPSFKNVSQANITCTTSCKLVTVTRRRHIDPDHELEDSQKSLWKG